MPPIVAAALTFGSFGDILEAARIAKRIIDALRNAPGGSHRRRKAIATLEALCDDMAKLTLLFHEGNFTDRLWTEVHLCRVLVDEFSAKLHSYEAAGLAAFFGRIRMATLEERELSSWMARIWERRAALHDLLLSLHSIQLHEVGEQLGRVGSQAHYIGSRVDAVEAQVQNIGNIGTLGVLVSTFLSTQVSQRGSEIRQAVSEIHQVGADMQQILRTISLQDPIFFVTDPLGRPITIQMSHCNGFNDLDRLLKAYLHNRPEAGGRYVDQGDYSIVSTEGDIIPRVKLRGQLRAGLRLDMSIIKRQRLTGRSIARQSNDDVRPCPKCGKSNAISAAGSWTDCTEPSCGLRYRISTNVLDSTMKGNMPPVPHSGQEDQADSFRLVQVVYERLRIDLPAPNLDPRRQIQSWATWQPDPSMASPPSAEPPLLVPTQPSPGLFGPRSPRYADPPVALRRLSAEPPLLVPESTSPGLFGPRPLGESWATWRPDASMPPSPPSVEPTLLLPHSNSPGLFGPRSPRDWEARHG